MRYSQLAVLLFLTVTACKGLTGPDEDYHLRGTVVSNSTMSPVSGMTVTAYYPGYCPSGSYGGLFCTEEQVIASTASDSNGRFRMDFKRTGSDCNGFYVTARAVSSTQKKIDCSVRGTTVEIQLIVAR